MQETGSKGFCNIKYQFHSDGSMEAKQNNVI